MARNGKPWYNRERCAWMVWWNGKKVRLLDGKNDKATAKRAAEKLADLRYEARHNPPPEAEPTVASIIEAYLESASRRLAKSTQETQNPYLQSFAEAHGWRRICDANPTHLEHWLYAHPEWVSDWTKNFAVRQIQCAFNWAANKVRLIAQNPFRGFSHRPGPPRRDMTREEFQGLLRGTDNVRRHKRPTPAARFRQLLIFLWYTGCRPGEATSLKWSDVDFERQLIVLKQHKTARTQRAPRPRIIPLHPVVVRLLRWIQNQQQGSEFVFVNYRGSPWNKNSLNLRVGRARKRAGIDAQVKLYGVRHAFGTRAIVNGGLDIKTVAELMGHTTTRMTEHYLHLSGQSEHLAAAMLRVHAKPGTGGKRST